RYRPRDHALVPLLEDALRTTLSEAALGQSCVKHGAALLIITAIYERITGKYGQRGHRYAHMEVGYASENIHLQAVALGLATVAVGAFHDERVQELLNLPANERTLLIMPVGRPY
ncbi:MAG: SagB/ThcOx family dehydrogenase, partial [Candidatus Neomarinimicrobiota bacterium]